MMTLSEPTKPIQLNREAGAEPKRSTLSIVLWVVQVLLALLFIWAGGFKLVMPLEKLAGPPGSVVLPGAFVRFIGVAELLGGIGLILPGLLRIRPGLTPLAAAGLVLIMIGAVVITLMGGGGAGAAVPAVTGLLAGFVAYGRWRLAPIRAKS
jgi:uncharacterized membrane protein YphA (DoxX/SURF4 family)